MRKNVAIYMNMLLAICLRFINDRIRYRLPGENWILAVVTGRGGKAIGKNKHYFNIRNIDNQECVILAIKKS